MPDKKQQEFLGLGPFAIIVFTLCTALYALVTASLKIYVMQLAITGGILVIIAIVWYALSGRGTKPQWAMGGPMVTVLFLSLAFMSYFAIAPVGVSNIEKVFPTFTVVPLELVGTQVVGSTDVAIVILALLVITVVLYFKGHAILDALE